MVAKKNIVIDTSSRSVKKEEWVLRLVADNNIKRFLDDMQKLDVACKIDISLFVPETMNNFLSYSFSTKNYSKKISLKKDSNTKRVKGDF